MKFLVIGSNKTGGPQPDDPVELNREVARWIGEQLSSKAFDCAYYVVPDRGVAIVNADSHEDLLALLRAWPAYPYMNFEVSPLADLRFGVDNNYERLLRT